MIKLDPLSRVSKNLVEDPVSQAAAYASDVNPPLIDHIQCRKESSTFGSNHVLLRNPGIFKKETPRG